MKKALLKKRFGIPALVLVILITSGAVAAAGVVASQFISAGINIKYPTHESLTIDLGTIVAGSSTHGTAEGFLGLPNAPYDLRWTLSGDLDKFSSISIDVYVDFVDGGDGDYDEWREHIGTLTKDTRAITNYYVPSPLETTIKYHVRVTAKDDVRNAKTSIVSEDTTLNVNWNAVKEVFVAL